MARAVALLWCAGALLLAPVAHAGPGLLVGVDDDHPKWQAQPNGVVGVVRDLGLDAMRITLHWKPGQTRPTQLQQTYLHRIALTVALGQRVVLAVYGRAEAAPVEAAAQDDYCTFVAGALKRIPAIGDVVIWNEVNNPYFWPQDGAAAAYASLLGRCWDRLHALRPSVNVIDSTAPHRDPAAFIEALGAAYRDSGRLRPLVDTFGHNVYPETSAEAPSARHDNGSIDEGDYERLLDALDDAFGGTAQPLPGDGRTSIWYLEDGFQTAVPRERLACYRGEENERRLVAAAESDPPAAPSQADQLRSALELAYCQPHVGAFFNFLLVDESRLGGWQSGLLWSDGLPKPSYEPFKEAVADVHAGRIDCRRVEGAPRA